MVKLAEFPEGNVPGMDTTIWYNPTNPGDKSDSPTLNGISPRVTCGTIAVTADGSAGAVAPKATSTVVAPRPVMYMTNNSPATAGSALLTGEPSHWWTIARICGTAACTLVTNVLLIS